MFNLGAFIHNDGQACILRNFFCRVAYHPYLEPKTFSADCNGVTGNLWTIIRPPEDINNIYSKWDIR